MRRKLASLGFAAAMTALAFGIQAPSAVADCKGYGATQPAGPYFGGDPNTEGWVGVSGGGGNYAELNGGAASNGQVEGSAMGSGGYINTDGDYGQC